KRRGEGKRKRPGRPGLFHSFDNHAHFFFEASTFSCAIWNAFVARSWIGASSLSLSEPPPCFSLTIAVPLSSQPTVAPPCCLANIGLSSFDACLTAVARPSVS